MPITYVGPTCARRGCPRPVWKSRLCAHCFRLARMFGKDYELFAYEPLHGYADERDAVELPWDRAGELFGEPPTGDSPPPA